MSLVKTVIEYRFFPLIKDLIDSKRLHDLRHTFTDYFMMKDGNYMIYKKYSDILR